MGGITYEDSGVSVKRGDHYSEQARKLGETTHNENVINLGGSFGSVYRIPHSNGICQVMSTDGVGTKPHIAQEMLRKYAEIGMSEQELQALARKYYNATGKDAFAMSGNDVLCQGVLPSTVSDYYCCDEIRAQFMYVVEGIVEYCLESGCCLMCGETAEHGPVYKSVQFDVSTTVTGFAHKNDIITGTDIEEGDVVIGIPSNGVHSNGLSLVRRVFEKNNWDYLDEFDSSGRTIGGIILEPTRNYVPVVREVMEGLPGVLKGITHITGGGLPGNASRAIPKEKELGVKINIQSWKAPPIFEKIQSGGVEIDEMYRTFNMGIGMTLIVRSADVHDVLGLIPDAFVIGGVVPSDAKTKEERVVLLD